MGDRTPKSKYFPTAVFHQGYSVVLETAQEARKSRRKRNPNSKPHGCRILSPGSSCSMPESTQLENKGESCTSPQTNHKPFHKQTFID